MAERKNSKRNGRPTATTATTNGNGTQAAFAASVVEEITRSNTELAKAGATSLVAPADVKEATIASGAANGVASESNVNDEAEGTAVAFGAFVKNIGMAVAAAQEELDKTLRETAKQLSETKIEVVHTFEQELDDDGHLTNNGSAKMQALPLINYLMPTAYQWSRVYLEADMKVQEFNSKSGFDIMSKSSSGGLRLGGGFGLSGWSASGGFGFGSSSNQTSVQNGYSMDNAAGSMHMEATLEPRSDIELPKPIILQKGPTLTVATTSVADILGTKPPATESDPDPKAPVIGKEATLKVTVKKADGSVNASKLVEYSVEQAKINHSAPGGLSTNAAGEVIIKLRREGTAYDANTPMPVQVIVWLGMVSKTITVNM
jgi:hypothetical protein